MTETTVAPEATEAEQTSAPKAPRRSGPRLTPDAPGELATLEAQWLQDEKGISVTPAQVRAVLMYHGEFQRSEVRLAQRDEQKRLLAEARSKRDQEREERKAKAEAAKREAEAKKAAEAEKAAAEGTSEGDAPKKVSKLKSRNGSKKPAAAAADADL